MKNYPDPETVKKMAEGYLAVAAENAKLMEEFKYVGAEGWDSSDSDITDEPT